MTLEIKHGISPWTPWGTPQLVTQVAPGIEFVTTASHGGFKLDRKLNAQVPKAARNRGGWYEEDYKWAIPFLIFPETFAETHDQEWSFEELQQIAVDTLRQSCPDAYEFIIDEILQPGESWVKDERDNGRLFNS